MKLFTRINLCLAAGGFVITLVVMLMILREEMDTLTSENLRAARSTWESNGINDYDLTYTMHGSDYAVRFRGGVVTELTANGQLAMTTDWGAYSVAGLFDLLEMEIENATDPNGPHAMAGGTVFMRVRFNQQFGYPERYLRAGGMGKGVEVEVGTFTPVATGKQ